MSQRLPIPGGDDGNWGDILNGFLSVSLDPNSGSLLGNTVGTSQIQNNAVTNAQLDSSTQSAVTKANSSVQTVNGHPGPTITLAAADVNALDQTAGDTRYIQNSVRGQANGIATLDGTSILTASQLPSSVVNNTAIASTMVLGAQTKTAGLPAASLSQTKNILAPGVATNPDLCISTNTLKRVNGIVGFRDFAFVADTFSTAGSLGNADVVGGSWTQSGNTITVSGGAAIQATPGNAVAIQDVRSTAQVVEIAVTTPSGISSVAVILQAADSSNYYQMVFTLSSGATSATLYRVVAGSATSINSWSGGSIPSMTASALNQLRVQVAAQVFTVYVGGTQAAGTFNDSGNSSLAANTLAGFGFVSGDTGSQITMVSISGPTPVVGSSIHGISNQVGVGYLRNAKDGFSPTLTITTGGRYSLTFDGINSWYADSNGLSASVTSGTWVAVVNTTSNSANRCLFGGFTLAGSSAVEIRIDSTGTVRVLNQGTGTIWTSVNGLVRDGETTIIVLTIDTNGSLVLYLNGRVTDVARVTMPTLSASTLTVGGYGTNTAGVPHEPFCGQIFTLQRYARILTATEIRTITDGQASEAGVSSVWPIRRPGPTVPISLDRRLRGSNLKPSTAQQSSAVTAGASSWTYFWGSQWNWTWVKQNIDQAQQSGVNAIRIIGDISGVPLGTTALNTYLANQQTVMSYLASKGMLYYCSIGDPSPTHRKEASLSAITSMVVSLAQLCASNQPTVWALELGNEIHGSKMSDEVLIPWMRQMAQAVRAVAPTLPLSASNVARYNPPGEMMGLVSDMASLERMEKWLDFWDYHWYAFDSIGYTPAFDPSFVTPLLASSDKPVIFGEYGSNRNTDGLTATQRGQIYTIVNTVVNSDPRIAGAFNWTVIDDGFGLWGETSGTVETDISPAFGAGPTTF